MEEKEYTIKHQQQFCASDQTRGGKEARQESPWTPQRTLEQETQAPSVLQLDSWHKLEEKLPLSRYHFPATANTKDKEQRRFLGVSKASRQIDQMSHYNIFLGREANRGFT